MYERTLIKKFAEENLKKNFWYKIEVNLKKYEGLKYEEDNEGFLLIHPGQPPIDLLFGPKKNW